MKSQLLSWARYRLFRAHHLQDSKGVIGSGYAVQNARRDIRRYLRQQHSDYDRRGKTNREGSNNRRWRRYLCQRRPRVYACGLFEIVA